MKYLLSILIVTCNLLANDFYKIENIPTPPTKHKTEQIDAMCMTPAGKLAVAMPSGEIWIMDTKTRKWTLFAEGLHNPLGLMAVSEKQFICAHRPELTKITDTDGDGKADFYECLTDKFGMSGNYHEFNFTCVKDKEGNIFFGLGTASNGRGIRQIIRGKYNPWGRPGRMHSSAPYRGWIMKYTKDGKTIPWSSGHRTPNGLGFDLEGNLFVSDNQGDWVGSSKLFHVEKGKFYGHPASYNWHKDAKMEALKMGAEKLDKLRTRAAIVFPHGKISNSPTKPIVDDRKGKFGPFHGQMYIGEMNKGTLIRLMMEKVDGQIQGACVPMIQSPNLRNGINRFAFAPDNSLYVGHTKHTWAGSKGISRITWNGKTPTDVYKMNITKKGFKLTFTKAMDKKALANKNNYKFSRYWYAYRVKYGSPESGIKEVPVKSVKVSEDAKTVNIELNELACYHVHELTLNKSLKAQDGTSIQNPTLYYTVNRLIENTPPEPKQWE